MAAAWHNDKGLLCSTPQTESMLAVLDFEYLSLLRYTPHTTTVATWLQTNTTA